MAVYDREFGISFPRIRPKLESWNLRKSHDNKLCRSFLHWCPGVKTRCLSANERRPYMAAGGGMVYWKNWIRLRDAKKHTIKAFWWFKGDLISQWIPKFYLCDESNPINPQCGKISANFYISPPHPPHPQFYPQKWWKFRYTSWLTKKTHLNRPAGCAGQLQFCVIPWEFH